MSECRKIGLRVAYSLVGIAVAIALMGCPPPKAKTTPEERARVNQRILDSLRADSAQKCRQHSSFAYNYARSGLRADAISQFDKALIYCGNDPTVQRFYAQYLDQWGMKDSAFVHYRRAGGLDTTNYKVHFWLYDYYYDMGQYRNAIDELLMAARHSEEPDKQMQWFKAAADMMMSEGMQDSACAMYAQLQQVSPDDPTIAQSMLSCVAGDPEKRLAALRTACAGDTLNRQLCLTYAREAETAGQDTAALATYLQFTRVDPNDISMWEAVLRTGERLGRSDISLTARRELVRLEPSSAQRKAALVDKLFALERYEEGARILLPAVRGYPDQANLLYLAGLYYSRRTTRDDRRTALQYLDRAVLTNDPVWSPVALTLHDSIEPPLTDEEINQAKFFGRKVVRLHRCRIPGRQQQNEVMVE